MAARSQLENLVEAQVNQLFRGAQLESFDFPGLDKPAVPFSIEWKAKAQGFVESRAGRPTLRLGILPLELTKTLGGRPQRQYPMLVRLQRAQHDAVEFDLGGAWAVESLPPNLLLKDDFGSYSLTFAIEDGKVRVVRSFALLPARVEPARYGAVLRFCREVDAVERKWIELREEKRK